MNAATPTIGSGALLRLVRPAFFIAMTAMVLVTGAATAYLTTSSVRTAAAIVLLLVTACLYVRSPKAGLIAVWVLWLLTPGIRRLFDLLQTHFESSDPLALLPFLATGLVAFHALTSGAFSTRAKRIMAAATAGWALGIPTGLHATNAMAFALLAYVTGVSAFAIGYRERPRRLQDLTIYRVLIFAAPVLAAYGIVQYFLPLPSWDQLWVHTVDLVTAQAPQKGHIRVWSTLNSPATFAGVLGVGLICYLARRKATFSSVVGTLLIVVSLSLTFVRSSWFAAVVALLAFALTGGRVALRRVVPLVAVTVLAFSVLAGANGTATAVVSRVSTFGSLGSDTSANARLDTPSALIPIAIQEPAGAGLGQAGESVRLGASSPLRNSDNGYLALIYQTGPLGFLLVVGAALVAFSSSVRMAFRRGAARGDLLVFTLSTFVFVVLLGGDAFYGVMGVIFWYLLGVAVSSEEESIHTVEVATPSPSADLAIANPHPEAV